MMAIKFSFFAYGILAIAALTLFLAFSSVQLGQENWGSNFFLLGSFIVVFFMAYMFLKVLKK